jgi:hypothetical protein
MVMRTVGTRERAESVEDLQGWVRNLRDCPPIGHTVVAQCFHPSHGDEPSTWFYVEADGETGVARIRCLSGGHVHELLDSAERWSFPPAWGCLACGQSIAEVVYGISERRGKADWLAVAVRCVECGDVAGICDMVLPQLDLDLLLGAL